MLRINQLAKELGVSNHDVLEAAEKKLGLTGKSHSSNLTEDQASQLRRAIEPKLAKKAKGAKGVKDAENAPDSPEARTPLAMHRPTAAVKIVKAQTAPAPEPTPAPVSAPVLIKKAGIFSEPKARSTLAGAT
jgi:translation initiation factor IF-2